MTAQNGSGNFFPAGECTRWASERFHELSGYWVPWSGNAKDWKDQAPGYGWSVSGFPSLPSIACFQPGVQLADPTFGHVGIVEKIIDSTTVYTSNLNFGTTPAERSVVQYANFKTGNGVSFISTGFGGTNATPLVGTLPTNNSPGSTVGNTPFSLNDFMVSVLLLLKGIASATTSPSSRNIINFMISWAHQEGGSISNACTFNVLNTMQDEPGATQCTGVMTGIKAYTDAETGVKATVDTLNNDSYGTLRNAIQTNDEDSLGFTNKGITQEIAKELAFWSSGKKDIQDSNNIQYVLSIMLNAGISNPFIRGTNNKISGNPTTQAQIDSWGSQSVGNVPDPWKYTANALSSIGQFFSNIVAFLSNPVRLVKILLGGIVLIAGIVLLIKAVAAPQARKFGKELGIANRSTNTGNKGKT